MSLISFFTESGSKPYNHLQKGKIIILNLVSYIHLYSFGEKTSVSYLQELLGFSDLKECLDFISSSSILFLFGTRE